MNLQNKYVMKTKFNHLILLAFFALLSFTACQNEETQISEPSEQETIAPASALAGLMSNTTANFGAYDDVLDGASCFSVELPVTVIVSDITIVIETLEDLEELEDLFEEFDGNEDILDFIFPITIIFNDYTEVVIENEEQLENFITDCDDEVDDDVIECIDFVYPISFSIFNADFDIIDTISIGSDEEFYNFLEELEEDDNALIVSLNYPVTLEYANGETIEVNSNNELAEAIEAAEDDCDDDDEEYECTEENIAELLVECPWDIDDTFNDFDNYQIIFNEDGSIEIIEDDGSSPIGGNWELSDTDDGLELTLSNLTAFEEELGGVWIISECDDDYLEIQRGDIIIELDQDCDGDGVDCSVAEINAHIVECAWLLETNLLDTTEALYVYFTPNGEVLNANVDDTEPVIGTWDLTLSGGYIYLALEFEGENEVLNGLWKVAECEDGELYLINENNYIYLDQDCAYNGYSCVEEEVEINLKECIWNVVGYNDSGELADFDFNFTVSYDVFVSLNGNVVEDGNWSVESNPAGLTLSIDIQFENLAGTWQIIECDDDRLKLVREDDYVILERDCENDVNPFECYEEGPDYILEECDDYNDGFAVFNIYEAVPDCDSNETLSISFHTTASGAETNTDILEGATAYTNTSNPQTIYVRVALFDNPDVFYKYPVVLIVEDCNPFECFESFDAVIEVCDDGTDGPNIYDLTTAFANCTSSLDVITYHETQSDAATGINAIYDPTLYAFAGVDTIVYIRIESENQIGIFQIYLVELDCNPNDCSEGDVNSFLTECTWIPVSYNGDDNLINWVLDFEANSQFVIMSNGETTVTAIYATSESSDGVVVTFEDVTGPEIQALSGSWLVVECSAEVLQLQNGDVNIVLERTCD